MKRIIQLSGFIFCLAFFAGCDKVENPIIEYDGQYQEDLYGAVPTFPIMSTPMQRVLLEDFTGHDCGNCPGGHEVAHTIGAAHPDDVVVIAVHAGQLAEPLPPHYPADWRTPEGVYYLLTQVGVDVMPKGRINRGPQASATSNYQEWVAKVDNALNETPPVNIQINASYVEQYQDLNVHVNTQWLADTPGDYRLVVLITESKIIAPQLWYGHDPEYVEEYEHNHMLRGSVSGATGFSLVSDPSSGDNTTKSYTIDWNSNWVPENCEVVAFITEGENGRILNVAKQQLVN